MEVVDVLGDDAIEPAETPQSDEGVVTGIGFGAAELPVAPAPGLGTDEVLESELARIEAIPDTARAAEVRNSRLRAHAGPREDHGALRSTHPVGDPIEKARHERRLAFFFNSFLLTAFGFRLATFRTAGLGREATACSLREPIPPRMWAPPSMASIHWPSSCASSS